MRPNAKFIVKTICGVVGLFLYCEYLIYYVVLYNCDWPTLDPENEDPSVPSSEEVPVKVMVLADTHLLGSRNGHFFDKLRREWQMYRTFQTAMKLHQPDMVFILGDIFDEGLFCSNEEFEYYVNRFHKLFHVPDKTQIYVAVGNHDIGFHYRISPYLNQRFVQAFNSPAVQMVSMRGNHFIIINSMAMEGDGCFLCKPAEQQLMKIERLLKCTKGTLTDKCNGNKLKHYSRPVLMQHFPMFRDSDKECDDFDSAPYAIKLTRFRENWDSLSKGASYQLLQQLDPRLVLSGHTHHGCTRKLDNGLGLEITVPSFSWRNKNNPTYGLVVFTPNNYAYYKCAMPNESTVINLYIIGGLTLGLWVLYNMLTSSRKKHLKLH